MLLLLASQESFKLIRKTKLLVNETAEQKQEFEILWDSAFFTFFTEIVFQQKLKLKWQKFKQQLIA